jgi:ubiquinone/menaquinone biosynthesis C-methylase UbiE
MLTGHERRIDRLYGHGSGRAGGAAALTDSHRGYMNFGLWEGAAAYAPAAERMVERLGELLRLAPGARVIDAACGRGSQDLYLLARFGALSIDAIDVTRANIELARDQAQRRAGPGALRFHHASATRLPFADASFSHAICVEAAHHFDTRETYLREAFRVLEPGGRIALADIVLRRPPRTAVERMLVRTAAALWRIPPANLVTADGYRAVLARAGFRIDSVEEVSARTFPGYYHAQRAPERRRELVASRGRLGATVGAVMNLAAHRVYRAGLLDYLLVSATRPAPESVNIPDGAEPKTPGKPQPEIPEVPRTPQPEIPEVPRHPEPEIPERPQVPEPEIPERPGVPGPEIPERPEPGEPEVPKPEIPRPGTPKPGGPEVPKVPEARDARQARDAREARDD